MNCENNTKLEEDINNYFKFPIYYNDKKVQLKEKRYFFYYSKNNCTLRFRLEMDQVGSKLTNFFA